jgi:N-methylhydantoinase A
VALCRGDSVQTVKTVMRQRTGAGAAAAFVAALRHAGTAPCELSELRIAQTLGLNGVLARDGGPLALVVTEGFADLLVLARQNRADLYDPVARSPAPGFLAPEGQVVTCAARMDAAGDEIVPLTPECADLVAERVAARAPAAVAVCLLHAHAHPAHELALGAALEQRGLGPVLLSHRIDPTPREYERALATCVEAWLAAALDTEISAFRDTLAEAGFRGRLLTPDRTGRVAPAKLLRRIDGLEGGAPALVRALAGLGREVICFDLGSRSLDISATRDGAPLLAPGGGVAGLPLRGLRLDVEAHALGGETVLPPLGATVDAALERLGLLPGGGDPTLAENEAHKAIESFCAQVAERLFAHAVARNIDPGRATLIAAGGLGVVLAPHIAVRLGLDRIHLAPAPGAAGALALLGAPEARVARTSVGASLDQITQADLAAHVADLRGVAAGLEGTTEVWTAEIAATGAMHPERVTLPAAPDTARDLRDAWRTRMEADYGVSPRGGHLFALEVVAERAPEALVPSMVVPPTLPPGWAARPGPGGTLILEHAP